jgi:nucleoside-diphosphate-sugar epimerase
MFLMPEVQMSTIRQDCLDSLKLQPDLCQLLAQHRVAVIGGTGFAGTWIAETVAALNDELGGQVRLDLLGRSINTWATDHAHLAHRRDIQLKAVDVRSPFELPRDVTLVLYAAGVADPRAQASEPVRVQETALQGISHSLAATAPLERLHRFVNISSGLVAGDALHRKALKESDLGLLDFTRVHNVYAEARRAAESIVAAYASQYRIPVSTARAFTFLGPYQSLDAPWALNNFMRDALLGHDIRLHSDGTTKRSYLYGSDAAAWMLRILIEGADSSVYNLGGGTSVSHSEVAELVAQRTVPSPRIVVKSQQSDNGRGYDFFPDLRTVQSQLRLRQAFDTARGINRALQWYAQRLGATRRLRQEGSAS